MWTDFHVITMFAAFASLIRLPHSCDFLREPAGWKGAICLTVFARRGDAVDPCVTHVMKPTPPPIDPAKRTFVPPEPELSPKAAQNIVRVFVLLLAIPLGFEIASWFTSSKTNLAAATVRSGVQWVLTLR